MIHIIDQQIDDISYLMVEKSTLQGKSCPTVIYFHGFNGERDASLTIAYRIAQNNIRVILPDALMHGDREGEITQTEKELAFWDIVLQNVKEVEIIKNELDKLNLIGEHKIGIGGTSMGGITTSAVLTKYDWVDAGVIVMGAPNLSEYASRLVGDFNEANEKKIPEKELEKAKEMIKTLDLSLNPTSIENVPLLFWHGEEDDVVPMKYALNFYEKNKSLPNIQMKFIKEAGRAHNVSRLAMNETAKWFTNHLQK